jgi:SAM-dependent methyltransferase
MSSWAAGPPGRRVAERYDLEELARAGRLADWMFEQFRPYVDAATAEVGAGIGTFSERLLGAGAERLLLVEPDPELAAELERRFGGDPRVELAREPVPGSPALQRDAGLLGFVLCQNVLEHVSDDAGGVAEMAAALRPGGALGVLVPAHPRLYGSLDRAYGHERRYTRDRLERLIADAGLELVELRSFNLLGVAGWWWKTRRGATELGAGSLRAYEAILPLWWPLERLLRPRAGLSLIAVARRPG